MKIQPIGNRVLIKRIVEEEKTAGGIYIPESARKERNEGIIVAVGSSTDGKELPIKVGDRVLYGGYGSEDIEVNGEKNTFIDFKDVLAKIE